jgi:hypothetical protein
MADLLDAAASILDAVQALPRDAAGVLSFGDRGVILVEDQRICWVIAPGMTSSLTELLAKRRSPALPRAALEQVYRRCREERRPLGLGLVESGLLSTKETRAAFREHHAHALSLLAGAEAQAEFRMTSPSCDDPRFAFTSAELLVALAPRERVLDARRARSHLAQLPMDEAWAVAFARSATPTLLAVAGECALPPSQLLSLVRWASELSTLSAAVHPAVRVSSASFTEAQLVVTWRGESIGYAAVCRSLRAAMALGNAVTLRLASVRPAASPRMASRS